MSKNMLNLSNEELKKIIITILVLSFCFSFRNWGGAHFDFGLGIKNLTITGFVVLLSVLVHELAHKYYSKKHSVKINFKTWPSLWAIAIALTIFTNGYFVFAALWAISFSYKKFYRLKHKKPHIGPYERAKIAASGPLSNLALGIFAAIVALKTQAFFWNKLMWINLWIAGMNLFPFFRLIPALVMGSSKYIHNITYKIGKKVWEKESIPYMEGELIFFGSKAMWSFIFSLTALTTILIILLEKVFAGFILGAMGAIAIYIWWQFSFEPYNRYGAGKTNPNAKKRIKKKVSNYKDSKRYKKSNSYYLKHP